MLGTPLESLNYYNELKAKRDELRQQLEAAQLAISDTCAGIEDLDEYQQVLVFERYSRQFNNHRVLVDAQNDAALKMLKLENTYPEIKRESEGADGSLREKVIRKN